MKRTTLLRLLVPTLAAGAASLVLADGSNAWTIGQSGAAAVRSDSVQEAVRSAISAFVLHWRGEWTASVSGVQDRVPLILGRLDATAKAPIDHHPGSVFGFRDCYSDQAVADPALNARRRALDPAADTMSFTLSTVKSEGRYFCPLWTPWVANLMVKHPMGVRPPTRDDERTNIDAYIAADRLPTIRARRTELLNRIATARQLLPGDDFLIGQEIRFLLDHGDTVRAGRSAAACRASAWWCAALGGYVAYGTGAVRAADSLFQFAASAAPDTVRCTWSDLSALLGSGGRSIVSPLVLTSERQAYQRFPCGPARDSVNAVFWWLADPLYSEPGNERRAEHYARHVLTTLRSAIPEMSERWNWPAADGGSGAREMLVRYGWPTASGWDSEDSANARWKAARDNWSHAKPTDDVMKAGLYPRYDAYSTGRVHSVPAWSAVEQWTTAGDSTWALYQPQVTPLAYSPRWNQLAEAGKLCGWLVPSGTPFPPEDQVQCRPTPRGPGIICGEINQRAGQRIDCSTRDSKAIAITVAVSVRVDIGPGDPLRSFPTEHFFRSRGALVDAPYQDGIFRRDMIGVLALASQLPPDSVFNRADRQARSRGTLALSTPAELTKQEMVSVPNDAVFSHRTAIMPGAQMVSLEVPMIRYPTRTARARFAVTAPAPLRSLPPTEMAMSSVILISPDTARRVGSSVGAVSTLESAVPRMLPSRRVLSNRFAIYWETYGVFDRDSVEFTISIDAVNPMAAKPSLLDRVFGRTTADTASDRRPLYSAKWVEPPSAHQAPPGFGRIGILGREVTLRLSKLEPGDYWLTVASRRAQQSASTRTLIHNSVAK
jgi:hypothetical protein